MQQNRLDMEDLHYFMGIEVIQTQDGIVISREHYILNFLLEFGMIACKPMSTHTGWTLKVDANFGTIECEPT